MSAPVTRRLRSAAGPVLQVIAIGAAGFLVGLALSLLAFETLRFAGIPLEDRPTLVIIISVVMLQGVGFGSVGLGYLYYSRAGFDLLHVSWPGLRELIWFVAGLVGLFVALIAFNLLLLALGIETAQHELVDLGLENPELLLVLIPLSILLVGPGEELLFRGVIQELLRERFSAFVAIGIASVLFAVAHVGALAGEGILPTLVVYFVLSVLLGLVYEYSRNLVVPALIHGVFNAIQFSLLYVVAVYDMVPQ